MKPEPTILVTGVNGQVGFELQRSLQGLGRIVACDRSMLDLSDLARVRHVMRAVKPTIIINPAAYTAVDKAETDVAAARLLNAEVPRVLAEEAADSGAALVHYSSDYVFDGTKDGAYVETDSTNPQNVYGLTKLEGEQAIAATGCSHIILRTSWVYGRRGGNFLLSMLKLASERPELRVVADQIGAPTWSRSIASVTAHILTQMLAPNGESHWAARSGVYHFTARGETSWHGFAQEIFRLTLGENAPRVIPISASEYPTPAKRPANSRMSGAKLTEIFGLRMPAWDDALKSCLEI